MRERRNYWVQELERRLESVNIARARVEYYTHQALLNQDGCRPIEALTDTQLMQAAE